MLGSGIPQLWGKELKRGRYHRRANLPWVGEKIVTGTQPTPLSSVRVKCQMPSLWRAKSLWLFSTHAASSPPPTPYSHCTLILIHPPTQKTYFFCPQSHTASHARLLTVDTRSLKARLAATLDVGHGSVRTLFLGLFVSSANDTM